MAGLIIDFERALWKGLDCLIIHFDQDMPVQGSVRFSHPLNREDAAWEQLDQMLRRLVEALLNIDGIGEVTLEPRSIGLIRSRKTPDYEMFPALAQALREVYGDAFRGYAVPQAEVERLFGTALDPQSFEGVFWPPMTPMVDQARLDEWIESVLKEMRSLWPSFDTTDDSSD